MPHAIGCTIRRASVLATPYRARGVRLAGPLAGVVLALLPRLARADVGTPFSPASPGASATAGLFLLILAIAGVIFVGIEGALFYAIFAYRQRPDRAPAQFHGNVRLEILWTAIPALLLLVVYVLTVRTMSETAPPAGDPLEVTVVGHQWWWELDYPPEKITTANELHVPVGQPVLLHLTSADVIHSFWVPQLAGKQDANPGRQNTLWFTAERPGVYDGLCAELCGVGHAWMRMRVVAQAQADYDAWVKEQQTPPAPPSGLAARGQQIYQSQPCDSCHAHGAGPDLTHFGSRATLGAGVLDNTPENLSRWLQDPQAIKPGTTMPNFHLKPDEIQALTAYLEGLR